MKMFNTFFGAVVGACALVFAFSPHAHAAPVVVYGEDNRVDAFLTGNALYAELARSTAAMIRKASLFDNGLGEFEIRAQRLRDRGICDSERFALQMSAAECSGFLVGEDLLVTAGHCARSQSACDNVRWVFNYRVEREDQFRISVPKSNVYSCKRIIAQKLDNWSGDDYALIQLDRKVEGRMPLEYRRSSRPRVGDPLVVIGHPSGLPSKIADGAQVREVKSTHFVANLDTYGGNSGSAVFNALTGVVEGILVRGDTDYINDPNLGCAVTNQLLNHEGRGEDVTYIGNIPQLR